MVAAAPSISTYGAAWGNSGRNFILSKQPCKSLTSVCTNGTYENKVNVIKDELPLVAGFSIV